jgi:hypothetical protein
MKRQGRERGGTRKSMKEVEMRVVRWKGAIIRRKGLVVCRKVAAVSSHCGEKEASHIEAARVSYACTRNGSCGNFGWGWAASFG